MTFTRLLLVLSVLLLSSCVTETTGGFNVEASPTKALADYLQLSNAYLQKDDLVSTRRHLNNAMKLDSHSSELHGVWALLYAREGDIELAEISFKKALALNVDDAQVRNNYAAFLFSLTRYAEAYEHLGIVVNDTKYSARPQAFENMGLAALQMNALDNAEYAFNRALMLNSNQLRSSLELVDINITKGNVEQANSYYRSFLSLLALYNSQQNARSLWSGIRLEMALGNENNALKYGRILEQNYSASSELQLFRQLNL